jgi:hypothetical protein
MPVRCSPEDSGGHEIQTFATHDSQPLTVLTYGWRKPPRGLFAGQPGVTSTEGKNEPEGSLLTLSVGVGLCALGTGLLTWRLAGIRRELRLRREGVVAEGIVLEVKPTGTTINNVRLWRIHYRYRDHLGRTREGSSDLLSPDEASPWHAGASGTVRFDRLRPQDSVWVGKA